MELSSKNTFAFSIKSLFFREHLKVLLPEKHVTKESDQYKTGDWVQANEDVPGTSIQKQDVLQIYILHTTHTVLIPKYAVKTMTLKNNRYVTININHLKKYFKILPRLERLRLTRKHWISP
jgi:hypothetical protein